MLKAPVITPMLAALAIEAVALSSRQQKEWGGYGSWGRAGRLCPPDLIQERHPSRWQEGWTPELRASMQSAAGSPLVQRMILACESSIGAWGMHPEWEKHEGEGACGMYGILLSGDCSRGLPADVLDRAERAKEAGLSTWLIVPADEVVWKSLGEAAFRQSMNLGLAWWFRWPAPSQEAAWIQRSQAWCRRWASDPTWDQWCWPFSDALLRYWVEGILGSSWSARTPSGLTGPEWNARCRKLNSVLMDAHGDERSLRDVAVGLTLWAQAFSVAQLPVVDTVV